MRRGTALAGAVSAALLLVGCGGNPEPKPLTKAESPSASASASPSPTPPALPISAEPDSRASAIAFAKHYVNLINFAQATGKTSVLAAVEKADCESCNNGRKILDDVYSQGGSISGGVIHVRPFDALKNRVIRGWVVDAVLTFGPQTIIEKTGAPAKQLKGGRVGVSYQVSRSDAGWRIAQWTRAS